jgi:hypothetical protein
MASSTLLFSAASIPFNGIAGSSAFGNYISPLNTAIGNFEKAQDLMRLFNKDSIFEIQDGQVQTATQGRIIPDIIGTAQLSGNIIWSSDIVTKTTQNKPVFTKSGFRSGGSTTTVRVSFAIGICEGVVNEITNIYADEVQINRQDYRIEIFYGTEDQEKSDIMSSFLGNANTPNFKGLCYIVFDDFPLENFGNRIPNFTFEIQKSTKIQNLESVGDLVKSITLIPGSGEFVYDTAIQKKLNGFWRQGLFIETSNAEYINYANNTNNSNIILSLDKLQQDFPHLEWVSVVCTWFCNSLNIQNAEIYPACEFKQMETRPDKWSVANYTRQTANEVSKDDQGRPRYGGTPSDISIVRLLQEIKSRGLKVCFYPMIMVDDTNKSWRGFLSGNINEIPNFFSKNKGYNNFILHYANLTKEYSDAFIIGSELKGLTSLKNENNNFNAIDEFCNLAQSVKNIMSQNCKITYAANWDEYHHSDGGWFNMDKLWANENIDVIGIDAYFPLSNKGDSIYEPDEVKAGWRKGEGYDLYYSNYKTNPQPLSADYAWKNIEHFWSNKHWNPNGQQTLWQPKMKKIWFTEYGFPSVDCCTNEPNVFYSSSQSTANFPYLSKGIVDFKAQQVAIIGTEKAWLNSECVENKFLWTWDARPYPFFPNLTSIWSDGGDWKYGHWVNGKTKQSLINDLIQSLCVEAGFSLEQIDITQLNEHYIHGIQLDRRKTFFEIIKHLAEIYLFDIFLQDGKLTFKSINTPVNKININEDDLVFQDEGKIIIQDNVSDNTYSAVNLIYINPENNYKISNIKISNINEQKSGYEFDIQSAIIMPEKMARNVAENILARLHGTLKTYQIKLDVNYYKSIRILDVIKLTTKTEVLNLRISSISLQNDNTVSVIATNEYDVGSVNFEHSPTASKLNDLAKETELILFESQNLHSKPISEGFIRLNVATYTYDKGFNPVAIYYSKDNELNYEYLTVISEESIYGKIVDFNLNSDIYLTDKQGYIDIFSVEYAKEFQSISDDEFLNGFNRLLIGNEIIQFKNVTILENGNIRLQNIIRARLKPSSEFKTGEVCILLNNFIEYVDLKNDLVGQEIYFKAVNGNQTLEDVKSFKIKPIGLNLEDGAIENIKQYKLNEDLFISFNKYGFYDMDNVSKNSNQKYFLEIYKNNKIIRILEEHDKSKFKYTKEMQLEDFQTSLDTLTDFKITNVS